MASSSFISSTMACGSTSRQASGRLAPALLVLGLLGPAACAESRAFLGINGVMVEGDRLTNYQNPHVAATLEARNLFGLRTSPQFTIRSGSSILWQAPTPGTMIVMPNRERYFLRLEKTGLKFIYSVDGKEQLIWKAMFSDPTRVVDQACMYLDAAGRVRISTDFNLAEDVWISSSNRVMAPLP